MAKIPGEKNEKKPALGGREQGKEGEPLQIHRIGYVLAVIAAFLYAWQTPTMKVVQNEGVHPLDCVTMLVFAAFLILNIAALCGKRGAYKEGLAYAKPLIVTGVAMLLMNLTLFYSLQTLGAGLASVLLYTAPAWICIFFLISGLRKISAKVIVALVLAILGAVLALNVIGTPADEIAVTGIILALAAAIFNAIYNLLTDLKLRDLPTFPFLLWTGNVSFVISAIVNPGMFTRIPDMSGFVLAMFGVIGAFFWLTPLFLLVRAIVLVGSDRAAIISILEVPITLVISFFLLGETMVPLQMVGVVLVIAAVFIIQKE